MASSKSEIAMDSDPKPQNQTTPDSETSSSSYQPTSNSKSLTSPSASFSKPLEGANSTVSSHPAVKNVRLQGKLGMSHQEALATVTAKAGESQKEQLQPRSAKSSTELPPSKQPESSVPSSSAVIQEEKPTLQLKDSVKEGNDKSSSGHASEAADSAPCKPESSIPSSSAVIQEERPTLRRKDYVQEGNDKSSSGRASEAADSAPHKPESSIPSSSAVVLLKEKPTLRLKDCMQEANDKSSSGHASEAADSAPGEPVSLQLAKEKVDKQDGKQGSSNHSEDHGKDIRRTPKPDGYSWRKYGQKQVKNSGSSCSYYRCTYSDCSAKKKVQHLDVSGRIIGVIYKGDHNHNPPQNLKCSNRKRDKLSAAQVSDPGHTSAQKYDDSHLLTLTLRKEVEQAVPALNHECRESNLNSSASVSLGSAGAEHSKTPDPFPTLRLKSEAVTLPAEAEHCKSSKSDVVSRTDPVKECDVVPLKKRRHFNQWIQESSKACPEPVCRAFKESKVVMHAARGAENLSDGYRWRKYGQKMVKGNPNPRSYYRCSSAGCPVRKHVERATHDSTTIIVTYEGIHDHDKPVNSEPVYVKPVPKKCHSRNSPAHVAATTTPVHKLELKSPSPSQAPSASGSRDVDSDVDGDKPAEVGADKVLESARTLLSIGIELKSC